MTLKFNLDLIESDTEIRSMILNALLDDMNQVMKKSISDIDNNIKDIIRNNLKQEPEYASLRSGQLRAEFGIKDPNDVDKVIDAMMNTSKMIFVPLKITNNGLSGGFKYTLLNTDDLGGVIFADIASVLDDKGYYLPWLKWLIYEGGKPLVKKFIVKMGTYSNSRSGMAIMVKSKSNWRVPPQFAGTVTSNWITRAIDRSDKEIHSMIQKTIESKIP